ncbi:hypothetical protein EV697_10140 [Bisgaardia hudsonensis]|uniref:Lipoprotein n=1 Tax=Bisgaardia hudsonensis TaxID=109472 RepID=A0A4R2N237_9PAST|nr:hypothetical protein [Bisgaardia hudsonensis]QLB12397.1 hypothetical protein A6A11_01610 [Bisgaardia hudsonensis]TCP13924.1 hypothetical protein EV697_10140 [Bisgaardia hudsonensis]
MNKLLFLLSIILGLVACATQKPKDENLLPSGIMQPVDYQGKDKIDLFPEIKEQAIQSNMN